MIDIITAMASQTDVELSRCLGVELDWTAFIARILKQRQSWNNNGLFEDMMTDIVTGLIQTLNGKNKLSEKIQWCRATSVSEDELVNKLKPIIATAVHYRFRDFRRRPSYNIGNCQIPTFEGDDLQVFYENPGSESDATELCVMIQNELAFQQKNAVGMRRTILDKAAAMFPDRVEGMGLGAICQKHGWNKGKIVSLALGEIYKATTKVVDKFK